MIFAITTYKKHTKKLDYFVNFVFEDYSPSNFFDIILRDEFATLTEFYKSTPPIEDEMFVRWDPSASHRTIFSMSQKEKTFERSLEMLSLFLPEKASIVVPYVDFVSMKKFAVALNRHFDTQHVTVIVETKEEIIPMRKHKYDH